MRTTPARVWLWMAFGGIAIGVAGVAWDKAWHLRQPDALAMVIGFIWDSIRHIQETESATAHALMYAGLALAVVGIPAALALLRDSRRAPL